ncbi:MAG: DUF2059 domain-containing protein, partial [Syntrophobacteraceae bacterium]
QVLELYVKSGMEKQLGQLPSLIQTLFDQSAAQDEQARKLPKEVLSAIRASVPEAFAPEKMKEAMLAELNEKLPAQDIKKVLQWFDSPLGKKCTQLEEAASTPEAQAEIQQYTARLQNSPPTAERLKVLREFDSAVKGAESAVDIAIHTRVAVAMAIIAAFPLEQQRPLDDLSREMEKTRPVLEAAVRSQMLFSDLYTYRSLTEADIQLYTKFAKSPAGSKFTLVTTAVLKEAVLEGAVKWGKIIGEIIKEMKSNSEA